MNLKKAHKITSEKTVLKKERIKFLKFLSANFNINAELLYFEYLHSSFRSWYKLRNAKLTKIGGALRGKCSDFDCESLYLLVRAAKPHIVVETGVKYGASTSHILEALKKNGTGRLYSIDLKPRLLVITGLLVRENVKDIWQLIYGEIKEELPKLLSKLGHIDLFFHDSSHRFKQMSWEYRMAFKYLSSRGMLLSHDVCALPFQKNAFRYFCKKNRIKCEVFRKLGIALCN